MDDIENDQISFNDSGSNNILPNCLTNEYSCDIEKNEEESSLEDEQEDKNKLSLSPNNPQVIISHYDISAGQNESSENTKEIELVIPDEELIDKIVKQVEYYFCDDNIKIDAHLQKHIRKNKQGYVNLKVISSFNKVKQLTGDFKVVAHALRASSKVLQVNDAGNKVRRPNLPSELLHSQQKNKQQLKNKFSAEEDKMDATLKTVFAINLPSDDETSLREIFGRCGTVLQFNLISRDGHGTDESLSTKYKSLLDKHLNVDFHTTQFALVEYENREDAVFSCRELTSETDWRRGMRVTMLARGECRNKSDWKIDMTHHQQQQKTNNNESRDAQENENDSSFTAAGNKKKNNRRNKKKKSLDPQKTAGGRIAEIQQEDAAKASQSSSGSDVETTVKSKGNSDLDKWGITIPGSGGKNRRDKGKYGGSPVVYSQSFGSPGKGSSHYCLSNFNHPDRPFKSYKMMSLLDDVSFRPGSAGLKNHHPEDGGTTGSSGGRNTPTNHAAALKGGPKKILELHQLDEQLRIRSNSFGGGGGGVKNKYSTANQNRDSKNTGSYYYDHHHYQNYNNFRNEGVGKENNNCSSNDDHHHKQQQQQQHSPWVIKRLQAQKMDLSGNFQQSTNSSPSLNNLSDKDGSSLSIGKTTNQDNAVSGSSAGRGQMELLLEKGLTGHQPHGKKLEGFFRQPLGPDGSKGFLFKRNVEQIGE